MVKLENTGKATFSEGSTTGFRVIVDGTAIGTAYRAESGSHRGNYTFGTFNGSRARLLAHVEAQVEVARVDAAAELHQYETQFA